MTFFCFSLQKEHSGAKMHLKSVTFYGILVRTQKIPDLPAEKDQGTEKEFM